MVLRCKRIRTSDTLTEGDIKNGHDNLFYFPDFLNTLMRLVGQLSLWSNFMKNIFQSNISNLTSSNVESYFKTIKRNLRRINTKSDKYRVDEIFLKNLEFLSGELKIASSNITEGNKHLKAQKKPKNKTEAKNIKSVKDEFTEESIFMENPKMIENWGGLTTKQRKKYKTTEKLTKATLLKNGSHFHFDS